MTSTNNKKTLITLGIILFVILQDILIVWGIFRYNHFIRKWKALEYMEMADKSLDKNEIENAIIYASKASALFPEYYGPHLTLGMTFKKMNNPQLASSEIKTAIALLKKNRLFLLTPKRNVDNEIIYMENELSKIEKHQ